MAEIEPLTALRYNLQKTGGLDPVLAPPYDVIDSEQRAELAARSPYNAVHIDLPEGPRPYEHAEELIERWQREDALTLDSTPTIWALGQQYTGPDGRPRTRRGVLARVRVEEYGAGRIRPHERTHPGPKEDRLRLTRATRANLSPIFSLYADPDGAAATALDSTWQEEPWAQSSDDEGTQNRLWRVESPDTIAALKAALSDAELLIADGHHRYETARVYAEEIGGDGPHRYVLMCLVALEDPGLTIFPTHRLLKGLRPDQHETLAEALRRDFEIEELASPAALAPSSGEQVRMGYIDGHFRQPFMLTLKDDSVAATALPGRSSAYRHLDTAVLEALILRGALGMSDEDIDHMTMLGYARDQTEALDLITNGRYDAAFFMAPARVELVQAVAQAGESLPPKSTYFFPKIPTGLVFNPLR